MKLCESVKWSNHAHLFSKPPRSADAVLAVGKKHSKELKSERREKSRNSRNLGGEGGGPKEPNKDSLQVRNSILGFFFKTRQFQHNNLV